MNKQDDQIKQLFDDYANELAPREDLASKARAAMTATDKSEQPTSASKKSGFWRHFAWIAPVASVASVLVIVVIALIVAPIFGFIGGIFNKPSDTPSTTPPTFAELPTSTYSYSDVKGRRVSADTYDDTLHISAIKQDYEVVGEHYYAFYTESGQLRYIKVLLGVRSEDGTFTEIELIAEVNGYVREDLKQTYNKCKYYDDFVSNNSFERGEYVTKGFFVARDMHFYVCARNGQYSKAVVEDIISKIL